MESFISVPVCSFLEVAPRTCGCTGGRSKLRQRKRCVPLISITYWFGGNERSSITLTPGMTKPSSCPILYLINVIFSSSGPFWAGSIRGIRFLPALRLSGSSPSVPSMLSGLFNISFAETSSVTLLLSSFFSFVWSKTTVKQRSSLPG